MQPVGRPVEWVDDPEHPLAGPGLGLRGSRREVVLGHDDVVWKTVAYEVDDEARRLVVDGRYEVGRALVDRLAGTERPLHDAVEAGGDPRRLEARLHECCVECIVVCIVMIWIVGEWGHRGASV